MTEYKRQRYLFMTLDPVHIGTGGYRLGHVDLSIVREPGTRVPKIPGTSLHGAVRSYAAQLYENPAAAGQSQDEVNDPDGDPVCYTFGYIKKSMPGEEGKAYAGVINIFDAHVLLFPVYSMAGPVWVSTKARLEDAGFTVMNAERELEQGKVYLSWERQDPLNLGWLVVEVAGQASVQAPGKWENDSRWKALQHIALVSDGLFGQVVNSNLEVRTSVSIDPETGAAEDRALFTYEAIPRATFLTAEVVLDDYRAGANGGPFPVEKTAKGNPLPADKSRNKWAGPLDVVKAGLRLIEWLGVGGMGTRGFGRMAVVGEPLEWSYGKEA